jgi:CelD/BcsL family acetyltransferase involved in cellulose biosynthesis
MTYQLARSLDNEMRDVGTVLRLSAVDDACLSGLTELDLLRGDEPYKRSFTTRSRALLRLRAAHGLRGRALLGAVRCGEAAQRALATTRQQWRSRTRRSRP